MSFSFRQLCEESESTLKRYLLHRFIPPEEIQVSTFSNQDSEKMIFQTNSLVPLGNISEYDDTVFHISPELGLEPECNLVENVLTVLENDEEIIGDTDNMQFQWFQDIDAIIVENPPIEIKDRQNPQLPYLQSEPEIGSIEVSEVVVIENPYTCDKCSESFPTNEHLLLHMSLHSTNGIFQCNSCNKQFSGTSLLKRHLKRHFKTHECHLCSKKFSEKFALNKHIKTHSDWKEKKFLCLICDKGYQDNTNLKIHIRSHTGEKPFCCSQCGKTFSDPRLLASHSKIHSGDKQHQCTICSKRFRHASALQNHVRTHSGEKPYDCYICGTGFAQISNLKSHMRNHKGVKPFKCEECDKEFATSSTFKEHRQLHAGIRPHLCSVCGKSFARARDITLHMRIHTGERPYECFLCGKRFTTTSKKNEHMRKHSKDKNENCEICGQDCIIPSHKPQAEEGFTEYPQTLEPECNLVENTSIIDQVHIENCVDDSQLTLSSLYNLIDGTSLSNLETLLTSKEQDVTSPATTLQSSDIVELQNAATSAAHVYLLQCSQCNESFTSNEDLLEHHSKHSTGETLQCNTCNQVFTQKKPLKHHIKSHMKDKVDKTHVCHICNNKFRDSSTLNIHIKRKQHMETHKQNPDEKINENFTIQMSNCNAKDQFDSVEDA